MAFGPLIEKQRIGSLDVLRGLAVLGILTINIKTMALIGITFRHPHACGPLEGLDYAAWLVTYVLFQGRFFCLFAMLFGAGIVLMAERAKASGQGGGIRHYRRMFVLLLIGTAHAALLWFGDILFTYAIAGALVFVLRKWRPINLIALGLVMLSIPMLFAFHNGLGLQNLSWTQIVAYNAHWNPNWLQIGRETSTNLQGWADQFDFRFPLFFQIQQGLYLEGKLGMPCGLMLIGMALYKLGVFSAGRSIRFYALLLVAGLSIGIPLSLYGVQRNETMNWAFNYSRYQGAQYNFVAMLPMALAWTGGIMLLCKSGCLGWLTRALAAVGRMALSAYIMQTVICTFLFYGHGLGLFNQLSHLALYGVVVAIWIFQLLVCPLWLRFFRFGPLEWLWRAGTYLRFSPIRRTAGRAGPRPDRR